MPNGNEPEAIPATFKTVFFVVVGLTFLSFIGLAVLAIFGDKGANEAQIGMFQKSFFTACNFGWQAGLGAILGLIGGKVTS
jgi:hypothetical protein